MKKIFIISLSAMIVLCIGVIGVLMLVKKPEDVVLKTNKSVGVWWWTNKDADKYLDFAKANGVDEIYYCDYDLDEDTYEFVKKAKSKGMKVYALLGEKEWILNSTGLDALVQKYRLYQLSHSDAKFEGIHLDIEPHQFDDFDEKTNEYLTKFVELAYDLVTENSDITFDFDIPAWLDKDLDDEEYEDYQVNLNLVTKSAYKHLIDIANRVFVMSYRDSAEKIISFAENELEYAKQVGKQIALCVETSSDEGDQVSFEEEGKKTLCEEIEKLEELLDQDYMVAVHHIKSWQELKNS